MPTLFSLFHRERARVRGAAVGMESTQPRRRER
jgi:hypothetical protein